MNNSNECAEARTFNQDAIALQSPIQALPNKALEHPANFPATKGQLLALPPTEISRLCTFYGVGHAEADSRERKIAALCRFCRIQLSVDDLPR